MLNVRRKEVIKATPLSLPGSAPVLPAPRGRKFSLFPEQSSQMDSSPSQGSHPSCSQELVASGTAVTLGTGLGLLSPLATSKGHTKSSFSRFPSVISFSTQQSE